MQITIDTNKDSKEDIEKAIQLLSSLSGSRISSNSDIFSNSSPSSNNDFSIDQAKEESSNGVFNMFGGSNEDKISSESIDPVKNTDSEEQEEIPKVQIMQY